MTDTSTWKLMHESKLPDPVKNRNISNCVACPLYKPSEAQKTCDLLCSKQARIEGKHMYHHYFFFDELTYLTWRLTK